MTKEEKKKFVTARGWHTWYNDNYWVHTKTIKDKTRQDYTDYGMRLDEAVKYEQENGQPWGGQFLNGALRW